MRDYPRSLQLLGRFTRQLINYLRALALSQLILSALELIVMMTALISYRFVAKEAAQYLSTQKRIDD
ncbi:hypothetical protein W5M_06597 [Corynebacterium diphtheriae bv. intermedius str. NCTC 5011]|nr:hypothetical protein W5M_06597 [Corynebacterium diphtheriae bv. intermedius str. NCTC 5011]